MIINVTSGFIEKENEKQWVGYNNSHQKFIYFAESFFVEKTFNNKHKMYVIKFYRVYINEQI